MAQYQICPRSMYIPPNQLQINSNPPGAEVYIDNVLVGTTPMDFTVKQMPLRIGLTLPGHKRISRVLKEMPDTQMVNLGLPKIPTGYLIINSVGVNIFIDGKRVPSGKKHAVPANKDILVKVINPINGQSKEKIFRVREREIIQRVIEL